MDETANSSPEPERLSRVARALLRNRIIENARAVLVEVEQFEPSFSQIRIMGSIIATAAEKLNDDRPG